jgi:predicted esterase
MRSLGLGLLLSLGLAAGGGCDGGGSGSADGDLGVLADVADVSDAAGDAGSDASDTQVAPDVSVPGLGLDYASLPVGATPRFEPDGSDWTSVPWPTDRRRKADGHLDLSRFPAEGNDLLLAYLAYGEEALDGFGLNGSIYVELDAALDTAVLPEPQVTMNDPKAVVQLVDVTPDGLGYGTRMPLLFYFYGSGDDPYYRPNTLAMRPVFGFPLREGATYCAVVTRGVVDASGKHLGVSAAFTQALATDASLAPLRAWLPNSQLTAEDLAVATCFTTQHATVELRRLARFITEQPSPVVKEIQYDKTVDAFADYHEFSGLYSAPSFQAGQKPYESAGGDLVFVDGDTPVVQLDESIRFRLLVPVGAPPAAGWPIVLYSHGTGGDWKSCTTVVLDLIKERAAVVCIDQPLHGLRGDPKWNVELLSFNFLNPRAGRTGFRQAAADNFTLAHMFAEKRFDMPAGTTKVEDDIRFDAANIHFFGHSHGGLAGALLFASDPSIQGGVLSGAGGVLIETLLRRKDPLDFRTLVRTALDADDDALNTFHPGLSVIQMLVDATDPINYARYWLEPPAGGRAKHVFITTGTLDAATPSVGAAFMAAAAGVPLMDPVALVSPAHILRGLPVLKAPVGSNVVTSTGERRTAVISQWADEDHFVVFEEKARLMWRGYFKAIRYGTPPVIDAPPP